MAGNVGRDQVAQGVGARGHDADDALDPFGLELPVDLGGVLGEILLQADVVQQPAAAGLVLAQVGELHAQGPQRVHGVYQRLRLGVGPPAGDLAVDAGHVDAQLLGDAGEGHGQLRARRALVHPPHQAHQRLQLPGELVAAAGEEDGLPLFGEVQVLGPFGPGGLGLPQHVVLGLDVVCQEAQSRRDQVFRFLGHLQPLQARARGRSSAAISLGLSATGTPAAVSASILDLAVPSSPMIIAPAWPMRLPGGTDRPAM